MILLSKTTCRSLSFLYPQYNRDDNRALVCFFEEEAGHCIGDVVFDVIKVDRLLTFGAVFDSFFNNEARLLQHLLVFSQVDKATGNDVRRFAEFACSRVNGCDNHKHALLRQHGAVADNHLLDVADSKAVYQAQACWEPSL